MRWIQIVSSLPGVAAVMLFAAYVQGDVTPPAFPKTVVENGPTGTVEMAANRVIVRLRPDVGPERLRALNTRGGFTLKRKIKGTPGTYLVECPESDGRALRRVLAFFNKQTDVVAYAEPDYVLRVNGVTPNDPYFYDLWGMEAIQAPTAWATSTGSNAVVVAIIDTGVDLDHPDLKDNIWINSGEVPDNGIDDDQNGYVDDYYGYDFLNNTPDPDDVYGHGTHGAGVIGAKGNNAIGVAGVTWSVKLMALKAFSDKGTGFVSDVVEAIYYATAMGAALSSNSYGTEANSEALRDAVEDAMNKGRLFVAAAGNDDSDLDANPLYPASFDLANVISVMATDERDHEASFSNYGAVACDLAAPGVDVVSTYVGGGYQVVNGTSTACAHVAGACALVKAVDGEAAWDEIKRRVVSSVDALPDLDGRCVSEGRLNLNKALNGFVHIISPTGGDAIVTGTETTIRWTSLNAGDTVKITLLKAGTAMATLADSTENDGAFAWTPDSSLEAGTDYSIEVASTTVAKSFNDTSSDVTDGSFSIGSATAVLTLDSSPGETPVVMTVVQNAQIEIAAVGRPDYRFTHWSADPTATASFADAASPGTTVTLIGDATVTANYVESAKSLNETFAEGETTFPPDGWETRAATAATGVDGSDPRWHYDSTSSADGDAGCASCGAGKNQNEWLMTPTIDLSGVAWPCLTFQWRGSYFDAVSPYDHANFIVKVSVDGGIWNAVWSFDDIGEWKSDEWHASMIDLSEFKDKTIAIAFQYTSSDLPAEAVFLDAVSVEDKVSAPLVSVALYAAPLNGGSVSPSGENMLETGVPYEITAAAADGYEFLRWRAYGDVAVTGIDKASATATAFGDSTLYAVFEPASTAKTVTLSITKTIGGSTVPIETVEIKQDVAYDVVAEADRDYGFSQWRVVSGAAFIFNSRAAETSVTLTNGDATVAADFHALTGTLKTAAVASHGGTFFPDGPTVISRPTPKELIAEAAAGYEFLGWMISGDAYHTFEANEKTYLKLSGSKAEAVARFIDVTLIDEDFEDDAAGWTFTNQGEGDGWAVVETTEAYAGDKCLYCPMGRNVNAWVASPSFDLSKTANPAVSFQFMVPDYSGNGGLYLKTSVDGGASWSQPTLVAAAVDQDLIADVWYNAVLDLSELTGNDDVSFALQTSTNQSGGWYVDAVRVGGSSNAVMLTAFAYPDDAGVVDPAGESTVSAGDFHAITATPGAGYYFNRWVLTGNGFVSDPYAAESVVKLFDACTLKALFSDKPVTLIAMGGVLRVDADEVGLTEFTERPRVHGTFIHPVTGEPGMRKFRVITKVNAAHPASYVECELTKGIKTVEWDEYWGKKLSEIILNDPPENVQFESLIVASKEIGEADLSDAREIVFANPVITSVNTQGTNIIVTGRYFGAKSPIIYVEHTWNENFWRYKRCKPLNKLSYVFRNAKGHGGKSCMKILESDGSTDKSAGYSQVYSRNIRRLRGEQSGYLVLDNRHCLTVHKMNDASFQ